MANKKISELTSLGAAPAVGDVLPLTDVSGTPTTKKVTVANLMAAMGDGSLSLGTGVATQARVNLGIGNITNSESRFLPATFTAKTNAANITYTAAEFIGKVIFRDCNGSNRTDVTPTAAQIVAEIDSAVVGDNFRVILRNNSQGSGETLLVNGGTGVTVWGGSRIIEDEHFGEFMVVLDNIGSGTEAVSVYPIHDQGKQNELTFGIADTNTVKVDSGSVADDEYARFTASGLESRSTTEVKSDLGLGTAATLNTGTGASDLPDTNDIIGTQDMWIPAAAMRPAATSPCADITSVDSGGNSGPDLQVLDFDKDSDEFAQFSVAMPKSWDGGNITFSAYWIGLASTDGVAWGLQVKALGDGEDINVAYGTAVVITDDSQGSATEINVSAASGTIACGGAAGDILFCQILRDVSDGNDDLAGDARLVGIKINYTTSALNDA